MEGFFELGKDPRRLNDTGVPDKLDYPHLMIGPDEFPPLLDMKLGDTGTALVKYRIDDHGGLCVLAMKHVDAMDEPKKKKKDQRIPNHEGSVDNIDAGGTGGY